MMGVMTKKTPGLASVAVAEPIATPMQPYFGIPIEEQEWPEVELPPTDLPYDDGDKMESPWHLGNATLLIDSYVAARGGKTNDFFVGANMFVYYSMEQVRNREYRGPDVFIVKNVDGNRPRNYWAIWEEQGRYPDVIIELLSPSTEKTDLGRKKDLYEKTFRTSEYFCVAPEVSRLMGWRIHAGKGYEPIDPDARGWLWSNELNLWLGAWNGEYLWKTHTWLRFYAPDGHLVLLPKEAAEQRAETAEQLLDHERKRIAELEAELARMRG